jgi:hypothetical protein
MFTFAALITCALGLGTTLLSPLRLPRDRNGEFWALSFAAGFGLLALILSLLGIVGALKWARWLIPIGAVVTLAWFGRNFRPWHRPKLRFPAFGTALVFLLLAVASLGAIAPVTEGDSLAYNLPIAEQLARDGVWRFWPHMARSIYPLSQEFLEAALIVSGNQRIGLVSVAEFTVAAVLILMFARRITSQSATGWMATIIGLGCPAAAFLAGSAKEDLLLTMMTVAGALALNLSPATGAVIATGLFAGFAAGAKYTGLPVALAVVACVPFFCGRHRRVSSLAVATVTAVAAGGLSYGVNLVRFGNPLVPLMPSLGHFPISKGAATDWLVGYGYGRGFVDFVLVPYRMVREVLLLDVGEFGGRGNWINPLVWLGVVWALLNRRRWPTYLPMLAIGLALYVTWFFGMQVIRLLLPAAVLFSIPAAEALLWMVSRVKPLRYPIALALALSAGLVVAVGGLRFGRYVSNPATFLERETDHFDAIQWMNTHLDKTHDRVASRFWAAGYLQIPWMNLGPDFQIEISSEELADPTRLRLALKRQGFTHVFAEPKQVTALEPWLVPVYTNPDSRLGGARFFRSALVEPVSVFVLK